MVKGWEKYVNKNPLKDVLWKIIKDIENNDLNWYDIKPLLIDKKDYFRLRKWKIRIIFEKSNNWNLIKAVNTRWNIYK